VCTGARRSQLLALRWGDIDLARGAIAFTRALVEGPDGPQLRPTKNRRSYRVALDAHSLAVLTVHRDHVMQLPKAADLEAMGEWFVFSQDPGGTRPWRPNLITKRFIRARRAAGLPHFRLHDLRHFMATQMLAAGVPIAIVSQRLSHARTSTTLNVYAHAVPGGDEEAAETLAQILASGRPSATSELAP
jgi:integrase